MADDNKSYHLKLDKGKGCQIELLDQTETMTHNSNKSKRSQKSTGTRTTLKLKSRVKEKDQAPQRPKEWDNEISNTALLQDLNLVGNEETKQHVGIILEKQGDKKPTSSRAPTVSNSVSNAGKSARPAKPQLEPPTNVYAEQAHHVAELSTPPTVQLLNDRLPTEQDHEGTVFDLPPPPNSVVKLSKQQSPSPLSGLSKGETEVNKGLNSISREIDAINQRLQSIPDEKDADVRTENSANIMNFAPDLPKKQPIDSYSRIEITGSNPFNGSSEANLSPKKPRRQLSGRELHMEITRELLKIERLKRRGYQPTRVYTIIDNLEDIQAERARLEEIASLESSVQMQKNGLRFASSVLEMANTHYNNLFDLNLDGWSDSLNDNIDTFEPIFEELHDKYKDSVQMAPELKLIVAFVGSAVSYHFSQQLIKKAENDLPGAAAVMRANPVLRKQYTDTAAKMVAQNLVGNGNGQGAKSGGGAGDLLGGLLGGNGGGMLSGLLGGFNSASGGQFTSNGGQFTSAAQFTSQPAPASAVAGTRVNNVQMKAPADLDELLGDFNPSKLEEATVRVDDDLTSHITGTGPRNVQVSSRRAVKKHGGA